MRHVPSCHCVAFYILSKIFLHIFLQLSITSCISASTRAFSGIFIYSESNQFYDTHTHTHTHKDIQARRRVSYSLSLCLLSFSFLSSALSLNSTHLYLHFVHCFHFFSLLFVQHHSQRIHRRLLLETFFCNTTHCTDGCAPDKFLIDPAPIITEFFETMLSEFAY